MTIVRPIFEEDVDKLSTTQQAPDGTKEKKMYHEEMPEMIKVVLHDYKDVFLSDLPSGFPPMRQGHEFKIDLQDDMPLVHRPIYKLSPLELEEAKKQI